MLKSFSSLLIFMSRSPEKPKQAKGMRLHCAAHGLGFGLYAHVALHQQEARWESWLKTVADWSMPALIVVCVFIILIRLWYQQAKVARTKSS